MSKLEYPVYEFRPINNDGRLLLRFNEGEWTPDDGEHDLAFITSDNYGANMAFGVHLPYRKNYLWGWCKDMNWTANVRKHPGGNAWHYMTKDGSKELNFGWERDKHPNIKAYESGMSMLSKKHGCANGRGIDFHVNDLHILMGLVREVKTKKILTPPTTFVCMYCGSHKPTETDIIIKKYFKSIKK